MMAELQTITIRWTPYSAATFRPWGQAPGESELIALAYIYRKSTRLPNTQEVWDHATQSWLLPHELGPDYRPVPLRFVDGCYQAEWTGEIGEVYMAVLTDADEYAISETVVWQHPDFRTSITLPPPPAQVAIIPTAQEVISEGQLKHDYFPMLAPTGDEEEKHEALLTFCEDRIEEAAARVRRQIGAYAESDDPDVIAEVRQSILFLTLARLWQIILDVMVSYDEESLPPEFVDPAAAERIRDYYERAALSILTQYDTSPGPSAYAGDFKSGGARRHPGPLGVGY